jgi:hypothetical protein
VPSGNRHARHELRKFITGLTVVFFAGQGLAIGQHQSKFPHVGVLDALSTLQTRPLGAGLSTNRSSGE